MTTRIASSLLVVLLVAGLVTAGCGSADDDPAAGDDPTSTAPRSSTTGAVGEATVPDTPVGQALDWVVEVLGGLAVDEATYAERFADSFREQISHQDFLATNAQVQAMGGPTWTVAAFEAVDDHEAGAELDAGTTPVLVQITVEPEPPHRIDGLQLQPKPPEVGSVDELRRRVDDLAPASGMLLAEVVDGECVAHTEVRADERLPIGSAFKLYVLGAVVEEVAAGRVRWDQPVTIRDELDSLPSGTTQDEPAGSTLTVEELALRMISVSDNTATDHLMDLVGRETVEAALERFGHDDPAVNTPMLTTRDLFVLKLVLDDEERAGYLASSPDERRRFLDEESRRRSLAGIDVAAYTAPVEPDTIEWFASPMELCRAMVALDDLAGKPGGEPIRRILGTNPAAPPNRAFAYVGFKGGSEIGAITTTWLVERTDGRRFVLTASAMDTTKEIDPAFVPTVGAGLSLVADL